MVKKKNAAMVRKRVPRVRNTSAESSVITDYASLLSDPCTSTLLSPYGGERGFVQRFTQEIGMIGAGSTAGFINYIPSSNSIIYSNTAASGTSAVPLQINSYVAGPYLTNAAKIRPIAACFTVIPAAASYNSLTGEIGAYCGSANTLPATGSYSVDSALTLCNARTVLAKRGYEVKWFPGSLDSTYNAAAGAGAFTANDLSDVNSLILCVRGFPVGVTLNVRLTVVLEWTPVAAIGIAATSTPGHPLPHAQVAAALHTRQPHWWNNFFEGIGQDVSMAGRYVARKGLALASSKVVNFLENKIAPIAFRAAPMLL
jgi:hypothetical protein